MNFFFKHLFCWLVRTFDNSFVRFILKQFVFAALLAFAAAKPAVYAPAVAAAPVASYSAAYTAPYTYGAYSAYPGYAYGAYASPYYRSAYGYAAAPQAYGYGYAYWFYQTFDPAHLIRFDWAPVTCCNTDFVKKKPNKKIKLTPNKVFFSSSPEKKS